MVAHSFIDHVRRQLLLALSVIAPCSACASMATQGRMSASAAALGTHTNSSVRSVFTSRLSAGISRPTLAPAVATSGAWGTVRVIVNDDDSFEYLATIYNPRGEAFTAAYLRRGDANGGGDILATLFSDVTLRTQYIQLRGTMSIGRNAQASALAEELREHPRAFVISVHSSDALRGAAIRGTIE